MNAQRRLSHGTWARCEACGHVQLVWDEGCETCGSMDWSFDTLEGELPCSDPEESDPPGSP